MRQIAIPFVSFRRLIGLAVLPAMIFAAGVGSASAQTGTDPAAPPPAPDAFLFQVDTIMLFFPVAETSAADFEAVMMRIKELLTKSDKPERQTQASSFQLLKIDAPQNGVVTYAMLIDPVSKGVSYDLGKIMSESLPPEDVKPLFDKLTGALKGPVSSAPLKKIISK
jgi:hypothetical protein